MIELILTALGLGVAGLDPAGALIAVGALGGGARERHVIAYGIVAIAGTVLLGTIISLAVGPRIADFDWSFLVPEDRTSAFIEMGLGIVLAAWGILRARRPSVHAPKPRSPRGTGPLALISLGVLFALGAILDPTFVSLVVIAAQDGSFWTIVAAHSIWILLSQSPLVLLLVAMAGGKHEQAAVWFRSWWDRLRPAVSRIVTGAVIMVGVFLLVDAGWWFVTGEFLVPGG